jgi:uracil-DNA glycosylase family 4
LSLEAPPRDCTRCPRLAGFRARNAAAFPDHHNAPVPSFGTHDARLLVVGLAPGLHGANRTGRPFTGDAAGALLYSALIALGFAEGRFDARPDDGLILRDCRITNAVRCVPPRNKPTGVELATCNGYLAAEIAALPRLKVVLALGALAHAAVVRSVGLRPSRHPFAHGAEHRIGRLTVIDSYHTSRLNTNTGRLTPEMFSIIIQSIRAIL